jgi:hypothetical protein
MPGAYIEDYRVAAVSPDIHLVSKWSDDTDSARSHLSGEEVKSVGRTPEFASLMANLRELQELLRSTISTKD